MDETGVPFDASKFVDALKTIYKHTHPPDGKEEVDSEDRKEQ